jgi:hypothetical protein
MKTGAQMVHIANTKYWKLGESVVTIGGMEGRLVGNDDPAFVVLSSPHGGTFKAGRATVRLASQPVQFSLL